MVRWLEGIIDSVGMSVIKIQKMVLPLRLKPLQLHWLGSREINSRLPMGGRQEEDGRCQRAGDGRGERATPAPKMLGRMHPWPPRPKTPRLVLKMQKPPGHGVTWPGVCASDSS